MRVVGVWGVFYFFRSSCSLKCRLFTEHILRTRNRSFNAGKIRKERENAEKIEKVQLILHFSQNRFFRENSTYSPFFSYTLRRIELTFFLWQIGPNRVAYFFFFSKSLAQLNFGRFYKIRPNRKIKLFDNALSISILLFEGYIFLWKGKNRQPIWVLVATEKVSARSDQLTKNGRGNTKGHF